MTSDSLSFDVDPNLSHWKIQTWTKKPDDPRALYVPYFDARDIANTLDTLFGWDGWGDTYVDLARGLLCTLSVRTPDDGWVQKCGTAEYTDFEPMKGGESDSFKRAASKLGVGRNVYTFPTYWERCEVVNDKPRMPRQTQGGDPFEEALTARMIRQMEGT